MFIQRNRLKNNSDEAFDFRGLFLCPMCKTDRIKPQEVVSGDTTPC